MKTKRCLFIFWGVLLLGLFNGAEKTHESPITRKKKVFKPDSSKSSRRSPPHVRPEAKIQPDSGRLPDVSVSCSASDLVVRVKPAFYDLGADAEELRLGRGCRSNGVLGPNGDLLFTYPLTACDGVRELPHGYLVYKFVLHYEPSHKRPRAHRLSVDIECHYPRDHHVHQLAVQPTWDTVVVRKSLKGRRSDFEISLMDDSWTSPVKSRAYYLGETINVQVSAPHLPPGGKLYISNCFATPSRGSKSSLKYSIIDNLGCMLDSRREPGASQFISRTHKTLRLSLKAFQFTADPDTEVNINCKLLVASGDPSPEHKSCTYKDSRWRALTGDDSICECCESHCATSKARRAIMEGSASSMPLLISDQPSLTDDGFLPFDMKREDQETNHDFKEQQSHEKLLKITEDEEKENQSQAELGDMTEPDLFDDFTFLEDGLKSWWDDFEVRDINEFAEEGSADEEVDYSQGDELEINLDQEGETLHPWVELDDYEEEDVPHGGNEAVMSSEMQWKNDSSPAEDQEKTWYFTWS
ncbi:zona pellucida sperm-binding protein 3 [Salarias fasciatus]|uniref:zona pellucida sperm-binding protein 3 n=1 Tax=Salarias fasciatus TaxID=181472 RepID=UPI001176F7B8|nr:zona pellucida sperm-binding protein 3-like [Salarias fasciatus]